MKQSKKQICVETYKQAANLLISVHFSIEMCSGKTETAIADEANSNSYINDYSYYYILQYFFC